MPRTNPVRGSPADLDQRTFGVRVRVTPDARMGYEAVEYLVKRQLVADF